MGEVRAKCRGAFCAPTLRKWTRAKPKKAPQGAQTTQVVYKCAIQIFRAIFFIITKTLAFVNMLCYNKIRGNARAKIYDFEMKFYKKCRKHFL